MDVFFGKCYLIFINLMSHEIWIKIWTIKFNSNWSIKMFKTKWRHRSNSFSTKKQFTGRTCCFLPILLRLSNVGHSFGKKNNPWNNLGYRSEKCSTYAIIFYSQEKKVQTLVLTTYKVTIKTTTNCTKPYIHVCN